jgi:hypothetical protein
MQVRLFIHSKQGTASERRCYGLPIRDSIPLSMRGRAVTTSVSQWQCVPTVFCKLRDGLRQLGTTSDQVSASGASMERTEALNTLRREYQSDYQKEIRAARDLLSTGVRLLQGSEGGINFNDKVTFVSLGQARKRFVDAIGPAIKPLLEAYARELEREAASLGLDGQATSDAPLMESLHDVLRHLQQRAPEPAYPARAAVNGYGQRDTA